MPRSPKGKDELPVVADANRSIIDASETDTAPVEKWSLKKGLAKWNKHLKHGWREMIAAGSWKTPVKVLVVTFFAVGVGVMIALLVQHFA